MDDSTLLYVSFGVPEGSILGTILVNLSAADMPGTVNNCGCLQYADDNMIYQQCKVKDIK